ncbi:hypothetical protein KRX56_01160 [Dermabacteraceae bacterium TAE3-ERU27]|nr:hypothetical protein [Dermabacteraceae bacterium TAE3-ERU27]
MNGPWYPPKRLRATLLASGALVLLPATAAYAAEEAPIGESLSHDPHASLEVSVSNPETTEISLDTQTVGTDSSQEEPAEVTRVVVGSAKRVSHETAAREGHEPRTGSAFFKPVKLELPGVSISFKGAHSEGAAEESQPAAPAEEDAAPQNSPVEKQTAPKQTPQEIPGPGSTVAGEAPQGTDERPGANANAEQGVPAAPGAKDADSETSEDTKVSETSPAKENKEDPEAATSHGESPVSKFPGASELLDVPPVISLPGSGGENSATPTAINPDEKKTDAGRSKREADSPQSTGGKRKKSDTPLAEAPVAVPAVPLTPAHTDEAKESPEAAPSADSSHPVSTSDDLDSAKHAEEQTEATKAEKDANPSEANVSEGGAQTSASTEDPAATADKREEKSNSLHILASNGELSLPSARGTSVPISAPAQGRRARGTVSIAPDSLTAAISATDAAATDSPVPASVTAQSASADPAATQPVASTPETSQSAEAAQVREAAATGADAAHAEQTSQEQNPLAIAGNGNSDDSGTSAGEQVLNVAGASSSTDSYVSLQGLQAALGIALVAAFAVAGTVTAGTLRSRGAISATAAAAAGSAAAVAAKRTPTHRRSR